MRENSQYLPCAVLFALHFAAGDNKSVALEAVEFYNCEGCDYAGRAAPAKRRPHRRYDIQPDRSSKCRRVSDAVVLRTLGVISDLI